MFSLILATAAAAVQPSPADMQDLRCMAAFASLASLSNKPDDQEKMLVGMLYYVGKIDGRGTGFDLAGQLTALVSQPGYAEKYLLADAERCGEEMKGRGAELQKMGSAMKKES